MKHKIILFALLVFFSISTFSQNAPGYLGKLMYVGYTPSFSLPFSNFNSNRRFSAVGGLGRLLNPYDTVRKTTSLLAFNTTHSFNFGYVCSRRYVFTCAIHYMKSAVALEATTGQSDFGGVGTHYNIDPFIVKLSGLGVEAGCKYMRSGLAPIGAYHTYKVGLNFYSYDSPYVKGVSTSYQPFSSSYNSVATIDTKKGKNTNIRLVYGFGKQSVIMDKFLLDTGFDFDMISFLRLPFSRIGAESSGYDNYVKKKIKSRTNSRDMFQLKIGVSYLF